jgi:peptide/nickel transport system permease protein
LKRLNLPMIFGVVIIIVIIAFMVFPEKFSSTNPYIMNGVKKSEISGKLAIESAPFKPSSEMIFGSDEFGRDMYSLLVYGTRLTMTLSLLVVLGRFLVALPLGITAGFGSTVSKIVIQQFNVIFSGIPALLIAIIVLRMYFFTSMFKSQSVLSFIVVLTIVGWSRLGLIIMERVKDILSKGFVKGEVAIGKSKMRIALENVIPHLAPELVVLFFMEIAIALTIIMQLGIFGVYVGNMRIIIDANGGSIIAAKTSFEPEWASMLAAGRSFIGFAPWVILVPAAAFILSIFGFNMFGEGLRMMLQRRDSKFIYHFRRALVFRRGEFSFGSIKHSIKDKKVVYALSSLILVVIITTGIVNDFKFKDAGIGNNYNLNLKNEIVIGTNEALEASKEFEKVFKELGFKPLDDKGFIREYKIEDLLLCTDSRITISSKGNTINLIEGLDYSVGSFGNFSSSGKVYDATQEDLFSIKDFEKFDEKFVVLDSSIYSKKAIEFFIDEINKKSTSHGVFCIMKEGEELPNSIGSNSFGAPSFWIRQDKAKFILNKESLIAIEVKSSRIGNLGRNVIGMIPGNDERLKKEAIIIGVGYNYLEKDKDIGINRITMALDIAKQLVNEKYNRTIIIALWDGNISEELNGIHSYSRNPVYSPTDSQLYLDLTRINSDSFEEIFYNAQQATMTRPYSWSFKYNLEKNLTKNDIPIKLYDKVRNSDEAITFGPDSDETMFCKPGIPTIIVSTSPPKNIVESKLNLENLEDVIIRTIKGSKY